MDIDDRESWNMERKEGQQSPFAILTNGVAILECILLHQQDKQIQCMLHRVSEIKCLLAQAVNTVGW